MNMQPALSLEVEDICQVLAVAAPALLKVRGQLSAAEEESLERILAIAGAYHRKQTERLPQWLGGEALSRIRYRMDALRYRHFPKFKGRRNLERFVRRCVYLLMRDPRPEFNAGCEERALLSDFLSELADEL